MGQETEILRSYINLIAGQQEYSSRQAGITAGIVLAVLVPIILVLVCVAYRMLARKKKQEGDVTTYKVKDDPAVRQVQIQYFTWLLCPPSVALGFQCYCNKPVNDVLCDVALFNLKMPCIFKVHE